MTRGGTYDSAVDRTDEARQAFGEKLRKARKQTGLTIDQMAERIQVNRSQYYSWESGRALPRTQDEKERIEQMLEVMTGETVDAPAEAEVPEEPEQQEAEHTLSLPSHMRVQQETKQQYAMPLARKATRNDSDDDRSLHEQLQDLGVEVASTTQKAQTKISWYNTQKGNDAYLYNKISVTKGDIRLGKVVQEKFLKIGHYAQIGAVPRRDKVLLLFKPVPERVDGALAISVKNSSARVGSRALIKWLEEKGLKHGRYTVRQVDGMKNVFACFLEEER